ncbi:aspartate-semialdehyde dehydrogenase [Kosmotoga olearia]|uniref:Aspartate-semialdehyde dehydrogenase n=1 Tax=Kosmotoga olearia (strain ATCC BAA-1733 / DSM 21960 / TBF 19.5.1) TaxID=521045 RepID=C5CHY1_KOSOT|nr:aspartate-semialdehyde dehydrogenase [Kosmotoga olearia]ACR78836.1 aspartate-semialdehyde dehydrogenase [Kosmotoga olearia TBF 19.5.1]
MRIAVVGATGEVGNAMIRVLNERGLVNDDLVLLASKKSVGKKLKVDSREFTVKELTSEILRTGFDYVLFSAGASVSREFAPVAAAAGAVVIDNSSAFRMDPAIPLVVPEINGALLKDYSGIVANPNCSTIQMVLSLYRVHRRFGIKTIVVSTYQAVSGAGRKGLNELFAQERGSEGTRIFADRIHRNVVPQIGDFLESGFTTEELKMINETRKILNDPEISIWPTTVRVPVLYGHSESIFVETKRPFTIDSLKDELGRCEDVVLTNQLITPRQVAGDDLTYVSRVRSLDNTHFLIWNVADNIRVGAATNAVRILQKHRELNS